MKTCNNCDFINAIFDSAKLDPHANYHSVLMMLEQIAIQNRIELIAGDCQIGEVLEVLFAEEHYSVCHYFRCCNCNTYIFIGACIRGTPIYKLMKCSEKEMSKQFDILWGNIGSYFNNKI